MARTTRPISFLLLKLVITDRWCPESSLYMLGMSVLLKVIITDTKEGRITTTPQSSLVHLVLQGGGGGV